MVKNQPIMQEVQGLQVQSLFQDPLEEEMTTHTVYLTGKSYGHRSLSGYSSQGLRVRHD